VRWLLVVVVVHLFGWEEWEEAVGGGRALSHLLVGVGGGGDVGGEEGWVSSGLLLRLKVL